MSQECLFGNHEYRRHDATWWRCDEYYRHDATWWRCDKCGTMNNFEPKPGPVAKAVNELREKVKDLEAKYDKTQDDRAAAERRVGELTEALRGIESGRWALWQAIEIARRALAPVAHPKEAGR